MEHTYTRNSEAEEAEGDGEAICAGPLDISPEESKRSTLPTLIICIWKKVQPFVPVKHCYRFLSEAL